jgi:transcription initiation factor TFIIB
VAAASGVRRDDIARCYRLLVKELEMEIPVVDPAEYMQKVASKANMDPEVQARALEMLSRVEKVGGTAGMDPIGLAASALYLAAAVEGQKLTQVGAAAAAGVTEVTIRNQLKRLRAVLAEC